MNSKIIFSAFIFSLISVGCVSNLSPSKNSGQRLESELIGKNIEDVAKVYGAPKKSEVGDIIFLQYSNSGSSGRGYSNICFLEIQGSVTTKLVTNARLGSNLGIDRVYNVNIFLAPLDVRSECEQVFRWPLRLI